MPINELIARGGTPLQIDSPMNQLAKVLQMQQMQQGIDKGQMEQDQYRQTVERKNNLLKLLGGLGADATDEQRSQALKGGGYFTEADTLDKNILERGKMKADQQFKQAETLKTYGGTVKQLAGAVFAQPTVENAVAALQRSAQYHKQLGLGDLDIAGEMQRLQGMTTPDQIKQWAAGHSIDADKLMPKTSSENAGASWVYNSTDPLTGKVTQTGTTPITQSADNAATQATSRANNAATVAASRENAAAVRDTADATRYAANAQRDQATEMKLADDYRAQSKDFNQAASAYKQINATLDSATTSPAATLAAATKFMKILDPGSVVRESELGMALQASGVIDRATNYINTLRRGKVLTPTQVADFRNISAQMFQAAQQVQQTIDADYKSKAKAYKLRPENVVQDLGQNEKIPSAPKPAPKGWTLHTDANGNKAYVSPDGKQFQEVK